MQQAPERLSVLVTLYLDENFGPRRVAIICASDEEDTTPYTLLKNFIEHGFEGNIYLVNICKTEILSLQAQIQTVSTQ